MCSITVINKHHQNVPEGAINIMRGSPLGNPFHVEEYGRDNAIARYRPWLDEQIATGNRRVIDALDDIASRAMAGEQVHLLCCCKPKSCHGDVIREVVLEAIRKSQPQLIYAGIGSRLTPQPMLEVMESVGEQLAQSGWLLRSGHADGADMFFERGARKANGKMEIFLPWEGFNRAPACDPHFIVPDFNPQTMQLAARHHPNWMGLKHGVQKLMARNNCQVLGLNLNSPVKMVICWTDKGQGSGGTGQAIRVAKAFGIPVFDLGVKDRWKALVEFVDQIENQGKEAA